MPQIHNSSDLELKGKTPPGPVGFLDGPGSVFSKKNPLAVLLELTRDYGDAGRRAIREFLRAGSERNFVPATGEVEFVGE